VAHTASLLADIGMVSLTVIHDSCEGNVWRKEHTLLSTW